MTRSHHLEVPQIDSYDRDRYFVRFFVTAAGELRCRITDVETSETWLVTRASELRLMLRDRDTSERPEAR